MNQQYCVKKQFSPNFVVFPPSVPICHRMTTTRPATDPSQAAAPLVSLTLGVALILLAAAAFGAVAEDVVANARITVLDARIAHWFHAHATPRFTQAMLVVTHVNGLLGTSIMGALLAAWFWRRGLRDWLFVTLTAIPGGLLLNVALKHVFHRARPSFADPLVALETYSFPSGHTAACTVFYGLLACWLVRRLRGAARLLAVAGCGAMVVLVAVSRMYLGAHYLSDVLAATAEGCAWLATCMLAAGRLPRRRVRAEVRA